MRLQIHLAFVNYHLMRFVNLCVYRFTSPLLTNLIKWSFFITIIIEISFMLLSFYCCCQTFAISFIMIFRLIHNHRFISIYVCVEKGQVGCFFYETSARFCRTWQKARKSKQTQPNRALVSDLRLKGREVKREGVSKTAIFQPLYYNRCKSKYINIGTKASHWFFVKLN